MAQQIREVMTTDIVSVPASAPVTEAARLMREYDIGDVLVSEDGRNVTGIITDRDIVMRGIAKSPDMRQVKVDDVASRDVHSVSSTDPVSAAIQMMREMAVRRLPVIDDSKLVGIVSLGDLARERDPESALADISEAPPNA